MYKNFFLLSLFVTEVIRALTMGNDQSLDRIVLCVPSSGKGTSGTVAYIVDSNFAYMD